MTRRKNKIGLVVSDLHCGHALALLPPDVRIELLSPLREQKQTSPVHFPQNSAQQYLWQCWKDMLKRLPKQLDFVVVNGDVINGPRKISEAVYALTTAHPHFQAEIAFKALLPIRERTKRFWIVTGTKWHEGAYGESLYELALKLKAQKHPGGQIISDTLILKINGKVIDIAHDISYMMLYRGTALERELNFSMIDNALADGKPDLIIRSHTHIYTEVRNRNGIVVSTPGWQLAIPFMRRRSQTRGRLTDIGAVLIYIKDEIIIEPILYKHPKYSSITM
ncbi:hypothetical protein J7M23_09080 [Candidatus Sumerlaeota bacterium]|nr:hypothetical protein [Candidatus Sumerlaeota bacterium]